MELFLKVAKLVAKYDCHHEIFWHESLKVFALVNDVFYWGTADAEEITEENFPVLETAFADIIAASKNHEGPFLFGAEAIMLFACRIRNLRPQNAVLKMLTAHILELFNACGPERPVGLGNP